LEKQISEQSDELMKSEKMATIGELTSRLTHDLRNPLTVLKSAHAVMKEKPNMHIKDRLKYNNKIDRAILKIVHLVDDVLSYVRISELELQTILISAIIDSSLEAIDIPNDVKINYNKIDLEITCDVRKTEAVISNLITNSIQAIDNKGKIEIRVSGKNNNIIIEIQDSGPGMTEAVISKIFEPLFTTKSHGTGLGLSICKTIVAIFSDFINSSDCSEICFSKNFFCSSKSLSLLVIFSSSLLSSLFRLLYVPSLISNSLFLRCNSSF